ncbi:Glycerol-1-phosphatase [Lentibacillus sp. JNUCC-1]|uniref:NUDIX hydrolase n=1 Tax=Lentibacillus sp. JNUCC-1 TaxID=2654513 RepID=UPI0012E95213|nr:NUDIX hydrolase [Lentibacillus sp. JNUCC-1]MUV38808.1 Glycerol-1-phosphatase [Lentibacillus sp. JNUCC-1]
MKSWSGSAAVCFNENGELLMVRAFGSDEWAVPSGGIEEGETPECCCIREVKEETGYDVEVIEELKIKEVTIQGIEVKTYYFRVEKNGESDGFEDPDGIIAETDWKSTDEIKVLKHAYPDDRGFLLQQF